MDILVLNAGSSTLKFGLFRTTENKSDGNSSPVVIEGALVRGIVERIGSDRAQIRFLQPGDRKPIPVRAASAIKAAEAVLELASSGRLTTEADSKVHAVGCRVVHGGANLTELVRVTATVLNQIRELATLAPLHNPIDADVIEAALAMALDAPVVAVFDTAFHHTIPVVASTYALPWELSQAHALRRYGFHGISHRYVSERLLDLLGRGTHVTRVITCHLGSGCSVCAIRDGRSIDTSMGLTPLEGLVMGSRSGDIDPGLLLYLLRTVGITIDALEDILNHRSGLAGLSGRGGDVRDLEQAVQAGDARAELALEVFAYRVCKYIGAYAAALGGLDAVAFTGGIGEHSSGMRSRICQPLEFLGLSLHDDRNRAALGDKPMSIGKDVGAVRVWVIPTDEELQIAREVNALLRPK